MRPRSKCRFVPLAAALFAGMAVTLAAQKFESRAVGVRVDVLVADDKKPVTGLSASDFELRDEGSCRTSPCSTSNSSR